MRQTPGGDPQALRRLSRLLEAGASELQRIRRRLDEAPQLEKLGLGDLAEQLKRDLGRKVHFMLYESMETAAARGPLVVVPGR